MNAIIPTRFFLTKGKGRHKEKLASFEQALREAGIAPFNLVKTSSIIPPHCRLITKEKGLSFQKPGQIIFLVMSENATDEAQRLISASVGVAIPQKIDPIMAAKTAITGQTFFNDTTRVIQSTLPAAGPNLGLRQQIITGTIASMIARRAPGIIPAINRWPIDTLAMTP